MITLLNPWKKIEKKTSLILSVALMCSGYSKCMAAEGLYVGIGTGTSFMHGKVKSAYPLEDKKLRKHGHLATAFMGYNHLIKDTPMFIGIEGGFQNHAMKRNINGDAPGRAQPYTLAISTNNSIVGHIRLGFSVSNISFYCKGGIAQTNFKTLYNGVGKEKQTSFNKFGVSTGIGAEAKLNNNFSIGLDHTYVKYGSLRGVIADGNISDRALRVKPEIQTTTLRLIYNF